MPLGTMKTSTSKAYSKTKFHPGLDQYHLVQNVGRIHSFTKVRRGQSEKLCPAGVDRTKELVVSDGVMWQQRLVAEDQAKDDFVENGKVDGRGPR